MDPILEEKKRLAAPAPQEAAPQTAPPVPQAASIPNSAALELMGSTEASGGSGEDLGARILQRLDRPAGQSITLYDAPDHWKQERSGAKKAARAAQWYSQMEEQLGKKNIRRVLAGKGGKKEERQFREAIARLEGDGSEGLSKQTLKLLRQGGDSAAQFAQEYKMRQKARQKEQQKEQRERERMAQRPDRAEKEKDKARREARLEYEHSLKYLNKQQKKMNREQSFHQGELDSWDKHGHNWEKMRRKGENAPFVDPKFHQKELRALARRQEKLTAMQSAEGEKYAKFLKQQDPKEYKRFLKQMGREHPEWKWTRG